MFKRLTKRKVRQLTNQAMVLWIEDLDDMIVRLDEAIAALRIDLEDLTDFVEDNLD